MIPNCQRLSKVSKGDDPFWQFLSSLVLGLNVTGQPTPTFFSVKAYYIIFEIPRKRPNEQSECDWSNLQTSIFYSESCDTQSVKK